jgi:hypothetical protein
VQQHDIRKAQHHIHTSSSWCCVFSSKSAGVRCCSWVLGRSAAARVVCALQCVPRCVSIVYICAIWGVIVGVAGRQGVCALGRWWVKWFYSFEYCEVCECVSVWPARPSSLLHRTCSASSGCERISAGMFSGCKSSGIAEQRVSHDIVSSDAVQPVPLVIVLS